MVGATVEGEFRAHLDLSSFPFDSQALQVDVNMGVDRATSHRLIAAAPPDGALVDGDGPPDEPDDGDVPEADDVPETDDPPRAFLPPLPAFLPPLRGETPPTPTRPPRLPSPRASAAKPFGSPAGPSPTLPAGLRIPANLRELLTRPPTSPDDETFAFDAAAISRELYGGFAVY